MTTLFTGRPDWKVLSSFLPVRRALLVSCLVAVTGCTSEIKITQISGAPRPKLVALDKPLPGTIGVIPRERVEAGTTKVPYASNAREVCDALATRLRELKAFNGVHYPVDANDRPETTVEVDAQFYVDPHLGEAKVTGFIVGLTWFATAPAARVRVTIDQRVHMTLVTEGDRFSRDLSCSYEAKFNPFGNAFPHQAGLVLGQNAVQHVADSLAWELIARNKPE